MKLVAGHYDRIIHLLPIFLYDRLCSAINLSDNCIEILKKITHTKRIAWATRSTMTDFVLKIFFPSYLSLLRVTCNLRLRGM